MGAGREHRKNLLKYAANTISCNFIEEEANISLEEQEKRSRIKFVKASKLERIGDELKEIRTGVNLVKDKKKEEAEPDNAVKVFVNGIGPRTTKGALELYFGRFGKIYSMIHMKRFAIISVESQKMVDDIVREAESGKLKLDGNILRAKKQKAKG